MGQETKRRRVTNNFDERLSPGEALLLWRRRQGWNQAKAAKHFKVSLFTLKLAEYDRMPYFKYDLEQQSIKLNPNERCLIYRKRAKKTQVQVAKEIGCGREWLRLQEKGRVPCDSLLKYWERSG